MDMPASHKVLTHDGKPAFVVLPYADYLDMRTGLAMLGK